MELTDSPLDLTTALRTTGTVRDFTSDAVDDATLGRVLDTARFAPSGGNKQGWHVIVVRDQSIRSRIQELCTLGWREYVHQSALGVRPFAADDTGRWPGPPGDLAEMRTRPAPSAFVDGLTDVPVLLIVCVDLRAVAAMDVELDRVRITGGGSIYPFVWSLLLAAHAEGLGGVMTTFLVRQEPAARSLLGLPDHMAIASMVALGHPVRRATKLRRRPVTSFTTIDRFDGPPFPPAAVTD